MRLFLICYASYWLQYVIVRLTTDSHDQAAMMGAFVSLLTAICFKRADN